MFERKFKALRIVELPSVPNKHGDIKVGDYMTIHPTLFMDSKPRILSDGFMLYPGQKVGWIHITENLPVLDPDDNLISAMRQLYKSTTLSLRHLATLCQKNDRRLTKVNAFYGISHLSRRSAIKLGFDIFEIENQLIRKAHQITGYVLAYNVGHLNTEWNKVKINFKPPREAIISRNRLVELYGKTE